MNYTKLLIYFILGFIVNIFLKRKNIEGFSFDILSASSYPDLIDREDLETTYNEILNSIHPHPTLSEAIMEATADALNEAIHI